jgi:hypothetical protein
LVRTAIAESWERASRVRFVGWDRCQPESLGIRIRIADEVADAKELGRLLDGLADGIVLNFRYENWSPECRPMLDACLRGDAVHVFGHALGFAHEQNRPDTPADCARPAQSKGEVYRSGDALLTPWDPDSVMNECGRRGGHGGFLSEHDVTTVQHLYGAP